LRVYKIGAIGATAGRFILDLSGTTGPAPQFWGVTSVQSKLDVLKPFGIFFDVGGTLQINTTGQPKTETIKLPGIGPNGGPLVRTYKLAPQTFTLELFGSAVIQPPGSPQELFRLRGLFYMKISATRFEIFVDAEYVQGPI